MALSNSGAEIGAKYGSVIPGMGTIIGAGLGGMFGGHGGPSANDRISQNESNISQRINNQFQQLFGRAPTQAEYAQIRPQYTIAGNPNGANSDQGDAFIAQMYTAQQNTPEALYKKQQADLTAQAPQFADKVGQMFQSNLGRDATDAEKTHFGMLLASGQDPYEIQQALQSTTEYQTRATEDYTKRLGSQLQATNADYFSKYIAPDLQAKAAQSGRSYDSSGVNAQLANAAQGQNYDLQNYLAQVSASQYGASTAADQNRYNSLYANYQNLGNSNISNALSNQNYFNQRSNSVNDYNTQMGAYNSYLQNYGKRNNNQAWGSLAGGIAGGALGSFGGPGGTLIGYQLGSGLGGSLGSLI